MSLSRALLTTELVEFMESGISVLVGTRDARMRPASARAFGAKIDLATVTAKIFVPDPVAAVTLANLRDNAQIAVTFSRGLDNRSLQIKGSCASIEQASTADRAIQDRYFAAFSDGLRMLGQRPALLGSVRYFPSRAIVFCIESMFEQTPGPGAGRVVAVEGE